MYYDQGASQVVKNPPAKQKMLVWSLGREDPLEKEISTQSSILAGKSHGKRSLVCYSPWGCKKVGHNLVSKTTKIMIKLITYFF